MTSTTTASNRVAHALIAVGSVGLLVSSVMMASLVAADHRVRREAAQRFRDRLQVAGPIVDANGNASVAPFVLDETEVSVAAYRSCVEQGGCSPPSTGKLCNWDAPDREDHPINCVDWAQAASYCEWAGRRLPTESEWNLAACGADGRRFPWGSEPPSDQDCFDRGEKWEGIGGLSRPIQTPLGTCPLRAHAGRSAAGALGMGGNVAEWTSTEESGAAAVSHRVVQSGRAWAWRPTSSDSPECERTAAYAPWYRSSLLGFRCARSGPVE